jgi:hypothetical protein
LQSSNFNFYAANDLCQSTIDIFKCLKSNNEFERKYDEVMEILDKYQIEHSKIKRNKNILFQLGVDEHHS